MASWTDIPTHVYDNYDVNLKSGTQSTSGSTGSLNTNGGLGVTKDIFCDGIVKTDDIQEATAAAGVTIDGVLLKDEEISARATPVSWTPSLTDGGGPNGITGFSNTTAYYVRNGGVVHCSLQTDVNITTPAAGGQYVVNVQNLPLQQTTNRIHAGSGVYDAWDWAVLTDGGSGAHNIKFRTDTTTGDATLYFDWWYTTNALV